MVPDNVFFNLRSVSRLSTTTTPIISAGFIISAAPPHLQKPTHPTCRRPAARPADLQRGFTTLNSCLRPVSVSLHHSVQHGESNLTSSQTARWKIPPLADARRLLSSHFKTWISESKQFFFSLNQLQMFLLHFDARWADEAECNVSKEFDVADGTMNVFCFFFLWQAACFPLV